LKLLIHRLFTLPLFVKEDAHQFFLKLICKTIQLPNLSVGLSNKAMHSVGGREPSSLQMRTDRDNLSHLSVENRSSPIQLMFLSFIILLWQLCCGFQSTATTIHSLSSIYGSLPVRKSGSLTCRQVIFMREVIKSNRTFRKNKIK
jgi:hypothetical protein